MYVSINYKDVYICAAWCGRCYKALGWRQPFKSWGNWSHSTGDVKHDLCSNTNVTDETESQMDAFKSQAYNVSITSHWQMGSVAQTHHRQLGSDMTGILWHWKITSLIFITMIITIKLHKFIFYPRRPFHLFIKVMSFPFHFPYLKTQAVFFLNPNIFFSAKQIRMEK